LLAFGIEANTAPITSEEQPRCKMVETANTIACYLALVWKMDIWRRQQGAGVVRVLI
jgi:hypothetical protein